MPRLKAMPTCAAVTLPCSSSGVPDPGHRLTEGPSLTAMSAPARAALLAANPVLATSLYPWLAAHDAASAHAWPSACFVSWSKCTATSGVVSRWRCVVPQQVVLAVIICIPLSAGSSSSLSDSSVPASSADVLGDPPTVYKGVAALRTSSHFLAVG